MAASPLPWPGHAAIPAPRMVVMRLTYVSPVPANLPDGEREDGDHFSLVSLRNEAPVGAGVAEFRIDGPLETQPPGLLVMDVDSTLLNEEVIEVLAERAGTRAEVARVTEAAMRGELDFTESLHARVATLAGLPESVIGEAVKAVTLTPGAHDLVAAAHRAGTRIALVSGGFEEIVRPIARDLGIEDVHANRLEIEGGRLTGRVTGPVVDGAAKAERLATLRDEGGVKTELTVAIGDGANDRSMVAAAGLGVAFCAKPALREVADVAVDFRRLDAVWAGIRGTLR